jgi:hypothetical protein
MKYCYDKHNIKWNKKYHPSLFLKLVIFPDLYCELANKEQLTIKEMAISNHANENVTQFHAM